jgi:hypothetical protein
VSKGWENLLRKALLSRGNFPASQGIAAGTQAVTGRPCRSAVRPRGPGTAQTWSGTGAARRRFRGSRSLGLPRAAYGSFVAEVAAPLGIGTLELDDGQRIQGFLCESWATEGRRDITEWGGWRAWLASREP